MPSYHELIQSKYSNFLSFIEKTVGEKLADKTKLKKLREIGVRMFVMFMCTQIVPYKDNLDLVIDEFLDKADLSREQFEDADIEQLKRYLGFFIEACSNT